jgi:DNA-binding NarL/FixJ family response regulator
MTHSVMIVEDEIILREAYAMVLEFNGFAVSTAANGQLALDSLATHLPDLILLDLLMPVMGGKQFLESSNILTKHPHIKIIVYSNISDRDTIDDLLSIGVHEHILKSSMSPSDLAAHITSALL